VVFAYLFCASSVSNNAPSKSVPHSRFKCQSCLPSSSTVVELQRTYL
jgi:transposase-like protein